MNALVEIPDGPAAINRPTTVLTPRGTVAVMVIRLERELEALSSADRAYIASMLRELIEAATV